MGPESLDDLLEPDLAVLYRTSLPELGTSSCRDRLAEMIAERWKTLVRQSCHDRKAANPSPEDALRAFDAIKHGFFTKDFDLLSFSLPELWRATLRMSLRDWLKALSIVAVVISTIAGIAFWAGSKLGK